MAEQRMLDKEIWCGTSAFLRADGSLIPPHKIQLMVCSNGKLYAWCNRCKAKQFIQDPGTIQDIMKTATVVEVRKKPRGIVKNGGKNGAP